MYPMPVSAVGWRAELVGAQVKRLVSGEAALAFTSGELVLERRSRELLGDSDADMLE